MKFRTHSEDETIAFGRALANQLMVPSVVLLTGNLGAGKTTLAKGILSGLGAAVPDEVTSPTFTLVHEYLGRVPAYHLDLYRLETAREVLGIGLDDLLAQEAVVVVEWGERFPQLWPQDAVRVTLQAREGSRDIEIVGTLRGVVEFSAD